jgi:hypothetical protein
MLVTTDSTCEESNVSQLLDVCWFGISQLLLILLLQIQDGGLWRQSALEKHAVFRRSMMDAGGDSEHLSSILLRQRALVKPAVFRYSLFLLVVLLLLLLLDPVACCDSQHV